MISRLLDEALFLTARSGLVKPLSRVEFVPVLHVERLYDKASFDNALSFARRYLDCTHKRAVLTVVTPAAPMLKAEMVAAGFSEKAYEERISALAVYSDVGVHGHFLRPSGLPNRPIHCYWNESSIVVRQIEEECRWLESRGLMRCRVYSAGWWYLDENVVKALQELNFEFDFSPSAGRYNISPIASRVLAKTDVSSVFRCDTTSSVASILAVSSICGSASRSPIPRRVIRTFARHILSRSRIVVSLYGHDWDMNSDVAMRSIEDLQTYGASFSSLADLREIVASSTSPRAA